MVNQMNDQIAYLKGICLLGCGVIMFGCGGSGQDSGTESTFNQTFSGLAIDGYLARSTVYLDTNNNGTRDAWEASAFTDDQGYFSYNPISDTDYCSTEASAQQAQYCLVTNSDYSNVVLRVDGGYDVQKGEPFTGQMSRRVGSDQSRQDVLISPLSSLLSNVDTAEQEQHLLSSLGLEPDDINVDYLNLNGNGGVDARVFNAATKVHKVVSILADRLTDTYDEIGEEVGIPNDASPIVYENLAAQLLDSDLNYDIFMHDANSVVSVLDQSEEALRTIYQQKEFTLPADMGSADSRGNFERVISVVPNVVSVINSVIDVSRADLSVSDASGQSRVVESLVLKARDEVGADISIENMHAFFTDENNNDLVNLLLNNLSEESFDLVSLSQNNFTSSDFDSAEDIANVGRLPEDAQAFSQIAGRQIRVSDLDLGSAPDRLDDSEVLWYFQGETTDTDGSFVACVKYIDDANVDGSLGEGNTRGERVEGFWSLLGASEERQSSFSLLLTLTFLETTYQAIMKPSGFEDIGGESYARVRFDSDGELSVWHSRVGFEPLGDIPTSNAECESRLPSRINI